MKVSVIIPVFNAASFLDECIQSALIQAQTAEVILIDDTSTDNSIDLCKEWVKKDPRVRLFCNSGMNGAGAARNVGLQHVTYDYVAFLDADDYYLEGRFDADKLMFANYPFIDAIANTIMVKNLYGENSINYNIRNNSKIGPTKINQKISISDFHSFNNFHIISLTIKSKVAKAIIFDEYLKQGQDIDFIYCLLHSFNTYSSIKLEPKAVYRIHGTNTTLQTSETIFYRRVVYHKLLLFSIKQNVSIHIIWHNFKTYIEYDFLWLTACKFKFKKILKILLGPILFFRILFKIHIYYDKDRTISRT